MANPPGFTPGNAFQLSGITADVDYTSLDHTPIVINEIRIQAPTVFAEVSADGAVNIYTLRDRIEAHSAKAAGGGNERDFRIGTLVIAQGRIEVDAKTLCIERRGLTLPEIRLDDIGGSGGAPPSEIAKVVFGAIIEKAASEIARSEIEGLIQDQLKQSLPDKAGGLLEKIDK